MISKERNLKRRGQSPSSCGSFLLARFRKGTPYAIKAERKSEAEALQSLQTFHTKLIEVLKRNKLDKPEHTNMKLIDVLK